MGKSKLKNKKGKGYKFDSKGDLHLTKIDYNKPENKDNQAFPKKDK